MSALPVFFALDGIASHVVDFRTSFAWVGLAFGVFAFVTLVWITLCSIQRRYTAHTTRCPEDGREAQVFVARNGTGHATDVIRCSLMTPPDRIVCARACLASVCEA